MRTNPRRLGRGLALAVVATCASLPQMAWAQQGGLFPLAPIKRHRVPCDQEDPIYKISKYQYFGYHPTCWHRFPDGWGCPSSEAPNREQSFKETPLGSAATAAEGELLPEQPPGGREMENVPGRPRGGLPQLPTESPFTQPGPAGGTPANPTPRRTEPDIFETPSVPPRDNPPGQPAPENSPRGNAPDLSAPSDQPGQNPTPRASRGDDDPADDGGDGPTLAVPKIDLPPIADAGSIYEPPPNQAVASSNGASATAPTAPPRRSLINGFLSNLGINWLRR